MRLRVSVSSLVLGLTMSACAAESATTAGSTDDGPRVGCPSGPFFPASALDAQPPLVADSSVPELLDVMADFLSSGEGDFWPQEGWRLLDLDDARTLVVHPGAAGDPEVAFMQFTRSGADWAWAGASQTESCELVMELPEGVGAVDWILDPYAPAPDAASLQVALLATERGCASGQAMGDRLRTPEVVVSSDTVAILLTVEPAPGDQDCPGNPSQSVAVILPEALGDRDLVDGRSANLGELRDVLLALGVDG